MLKLENVSFAHPGQDTPYHFNLELARGETLGVSGVSGSGKSTLLDLIAGFLSPSSGTISFDDIDMTHLPPEQRPVSILFQSDNLFDHLSVARNLALGLPNALAIAERTTLIENALKQVDLQGFGPRRASSLSGGQKQRAALARTLLRNRPILLLDEPFSALDPETATNMRDLVRTLSQQNDWCTVLVSHDPNDIDALATQKMRVEGNKLVATKPR